jgi:nucleoid-associated protein YgaU
MLIALVICLAWGSAVNSTSILYKNYIVHYDRGWDILCERYEVQKDDWVLKIFRQKGEIAHQDFRDFLGIFQRLNPHIKDIDMIRPGQTIDIPLRKLEHGSLPGQASGVVTIPFVTISSVEEVLQEHAPTYTVQRGDTVSKLISRQYGRYGSLGYQEGVKLFQAANPQITDLNVIYAGQTVYLPEPSIREQPWYASLYDDQGNLRETLQKNPPEPLEPLKPQQPADVKPAAPKPVPAAVKADQKEPAPAKKPGKVAQAAAAVGGTFVDKGTYFMPRQGAEDFEIDLSRHPMLEMPDAPKLFFSDNGAVMDTSAEAFAQQWPDARIVAYDENSSTEQIVGSIFAALGPGESGVQQGGQVAFADRTVQITVRSRWIRLEDDQRHLCITPIMDASEKTPEALRRYLEQNGVVLKEILPGETSKKGAENGHSQRHAVKNVLALAPVSQKDFVQSLANALGFSYMPNVGITFPYAGVQITAFSNLLSAGEGREVLVDYGDLYGEALSAIRKTGPRVIQLAPDDSYGGIVVKLLTAMNLDYSENPVFLGARRPPEYNTEIAIEGVLYSKTPEKQILLASDQMHSAVTDLISSRGIDVIVWP